MRILVALSLCVLAASGCSTNPAAPRPPARPAPVIELESTQTFASSVRIDWRVTNGDGLEFEVERRLGDWPWKHRATLTPSVTGRLTLEDDTVSPGATYGFRVRAIGRGDAQYAGAVTISMPPS